MLCTLVSASILATLDAALQCTAQRGTAQAAACRSTPLYSCVTLSPVCCYCHTAAAGVQTQNTWLGYHHTESRALAALVPKDHPTEPPATQLSNRRPLQGWPLHRRQQQGSFTDRKTTSQHCYYYHYYCCKPSAGDSHRVVTAWRQLKTPGIPSE